MSPVVSDYIANVVFIIARSLTKGHIERIKHPTYFNNVCVRAYAAGMIAQWNACGKPVDERWAKRFAHFRRREIKEKYVKFSFNVFV